MNQKVIFTIFEKYKVEIKRGGGVSRKHFRAAINSKPFYNWIRSHQQTRSRDNLRSYWPFHYHSITIDAVTMFGPNPGLIHITCDVTFNGVRSNRVVFIRGNSIGVLFTLKSKQTGKIYVVYVKQPRNATGFGSFVEIPAGMMDGKTGTLASQGVAAKEIWEELGIFIEKGDLILLGEMYPSPGGCDESITLFSVVLEANEDYIQSLIGRKTGEYNSDEQITLGVIELSEFKNMCAYGRCKDAKAMSAFFLIDQKKIELTPTRFIGPSLESETPHQTLDEPETPRPTLQIPNAPTVHRRSRSGTRSST